MKEVKPNEKNNTTGIRRERWACVVRAKELNFFQVIRFIQLNV
jgi:hypothetical protein